MPAIAVIGGGIAGLSAASRLAALRPDATIVVLEASGRVGGKLRRVEVGGAWVDVGAEAMLARRPEGLAAARDAGLGEQLIQPLTTSALLRNRGMNRPLPARTLVGIPADLQALQAADVLSEAALSRVAAESEAGPYPELVDDVTVGALVAERFGDEVVDRLVDPLLGGVYAGRARDISLQAAIPALAQRLAIEGGSLRTAAQATIEAAGRADPDRPVFASVTGGLARLAEQLAASGEFEVRTATTVRSIRRRAAGFALLLGPTADEHEIVVDAVVVATPAGKAAALLRDVSPDAAAELAGIETASMAIVTLAFASSAAESLPAGSGILVPEIEGLDIKAMTFSSQKWPGVGADAGVSLLRASLGRAGDELTLQRTDAELLAAVADQLAVVTGLRAAPVDSHVQRWGGVLPQYALGHVQRVGRIRAAVGRVPGLAVCGASYDGVGIPACVASAHIAAAQVLPALTPVAQ